MGETYETGVLSQPATMLYCNPQRLFQAAVSQHAGLHRRRVALRYACMEPTTSCARTFYDMHSYTIFRRSSQKCRAYPLIHRRDGRTASTVSMAGLHRRRYKRLLFALAMHEEYKTE